jgi:hypothetical protein
MICCGLLAIFVAIFQLLFLKEIIKTGPEISYQQLHVLTNRATADMYYVYKLSLLL